MNKGRYVNKLTLARQHRQNWYLVTFYKFMDKVSAGVEANPTKVKERLDKIKAVKK